MRTYYQEVSFPASVPESYRMATSALVIEDGRVIKDRINAFPKTSVGGQPGTERGMERAESDADACLDKRLANPSYLCNRLKGHDGNHAWIDHTGTIRSVWPPTFGGVPRSAVFLDEEPPVETTPRSQVLQGIYNPGPEGRCKKMANLEGTSIQCNLSAQHEGWAHQSREHYLIWES